MITTIPTIGVAMPTDADWGRLYKYNTTGDSGIVMPFRSYYFRDFFAGSWTNMAMGFIYRNSGAASDIADVASERQSETAVANLPHFGISKSGSGTIPVASNPYFLGLRGYLGGVTQITAGATPTLGQLGCTIVNEGLDLTSGTPIEIKIKQGTPTDAFAMLGMRFVFDPSTNLVTIRVAKTDALSLASDAANVTTLVDFLSTISSEQAGANASFPIYNITNFSSFYIYWPYLTNKLMLHCVGAIKSA